MTVLVIAHRGASAALPEHTSAAYRQAIEDGADGLECDVRLTRDGHLVCIHDRRLDRTSNGRGRVSAATLDQLRALDFGSWHTPRPMPAAVLTLDQLLTIAVDSARPLRLLIETKHPSRYGAEVELRLVELLRRYGLADGSTARPVQVTVMSFSPFALRRFKRLAPALPTVFLFEVAPPMVRDGRTPFGVHILGPSIAAVRARPEIVHRAHERGRDVYVWTANEPEEIELVLELGVAAVITDRPAEVLARLGR